MKQSSFVLKTTADGSDTLFSADMTESYHSVNGAAQESRHVFIEAGLHQITKRSIKIFEVGFGTGLNALITWADARKNNIQIDYDAIEAFPVSKDVIKSLNYKDLEPTLPSEAFLQLHEIQWNDRAILEQNRFSLLKLQGDFTSIDIGENYDLVYFDAFSPDKQPEMWEEDLFRKLYDAMNENGILVTYCAKGEVRRRMQRAGFLVERIPGPPGKREMLRATKSSSYQIVHPY